MTRDNRELHESLLAETMLSVMVATTLLTCLMIVRVFNEYLVVSPGAQLSTLLLPVIQTLVRRRWPKLLPCFLLNIASAIVFFFALFLISVTGFAKNTSNTVYLVLIVIAFTIMSVRYRFRPTLKASDPQTIALPACIIPMFAILYILGKREDVIEMLIIQLFIIAVLCLAMRQVATFDEKYYHSIRKSSRPVKYLKRQNYMTAAGLVGIIIIAYLVLQFIPTQVLTEFIRSILMAILPGIFMALMAIIDFVGSVLLGDDTVLEPVKNELTGRPDAQDELWIYILAAVLAVVILITFIIVIINTIRLIIQNAPRYRIEKEAAGGDAIVDTIESIAPEKKLTAKRLHDFGTGYERKIRKQFYDKTRRAMAKGLPVSSSSTPGQIEAALLAKGDSEISELRPEYEKVRYGKKNKTTS